MATNILDLLQANSVQADKAPWDKLAEELAAKKKQEETLAMGRAVASAQMQNGVQNPDIDFQASQASYVDYAPAPMSKDEKMLQQQLEAQIQQGIANRANQVEFDKLNMQQALANQGGFAKADLSPLFATARMLGAKDAGAGYKPKENLTPQELSALNKNVQAGQAGMTDDQINLLKMKLMNKASDRQAGTQSRFLAAQDTQNFYKVKTAFDAPVKDFNEFQQQVGVVRGAIASGEIGRLNSAIANLSRMGGEKGVLTDQDIARAVPATMRNKVAQAIQFYANDPSYQADPAVLKVIADNIGALEKAAMDKYTARLEQQKSFFQGAPGTIEKHANKIYGDAVSLAKKNMGAASAGATTQKPLSESEKEELKALEAKYGK